MELERRPGSPATRALVIGLQRGAAFFSRHWLWFVNGFWGLLLFGSLVAPTLMALGLESPARVAYSIYSFTCHQLPERSFFLFGSEGPLAMYELPTLVEAGANPETLLTQRSYVGSPEMGWKLGFSDRMVSMYGGAFLGGILFWLLRRVGWRGPLPIALLLLMTIPMALDGSSHFLSEVTRTGFRETNGWAMALLGEQGPDFYTGTTFGSLNSTLRLWTGLLFGVGMMLFAYPLMALGFDDLADEAERTLARNQSRVA